jgi:sulfite exporter TauE/SafE
MAKKKSKISKAERRIMFAVEEIVLSFVGALVMAFGVMVIASPANGWLANFVLGVFIVWLGLLLFTVPLIRKIEQLM